MNDCTSCRWDGGNRDDPQGVVFGSSLRHLCRSQPEVLAVDGLGCGRHRDNRPEAITLDGIPCPYCKEQITLPNWQEIHIDVALMEAASATSKVQGKG